MAKQMDTDIAALQSDITQLRADLAKISSTMRDIAGNGVAGAEETLQASTERVWGEAKRHAQNVGREIEERPFAAALAAFGTGILLGLLLNARRG